MSLHASLGSGRACTCMLPAAASLPGARQSAPRPQMRLSACRPRPAAVSSGGDGVASASLRLPRQQPAQHARRCRPCAATRGRPKKSSTDSDNEQMRDGNRLVTFSEGQVEGVEDLALEQQERFFQDDEAELDCWVDKVVDWYDFDTRADVTAGMHDAEAGELPWSSAKQRRSKVSGRRLSKLRKRADFIGLMPIPERKVFEPSEPPPEPEAPFVNPDWGEWEFRAYVEKQARKARDLDAWNDRRGTIGEHEPLQVDDQTDLRLQRPWDEQERVWTNEEIFNLITLDGVAAKPSDVVVGISDPDGREDLQETGGEYHESTVDYLIRLGHMTMHEPREEDLVDLGVTQLAGDFEGLDQQQEGSDGESGEEGTQPSGAAADAAGATRPAADAEQAAQMAELGYTYGSNVVFSEIVEEGFE